MTASRERSDGSVDLPEGTVYTAVRRLHDAGLLNSDWEHVGGRRRRVYRLTSGGPGALAVEQSGWTRFASAVEQVVQPAGLATR